MPARRAPEFEFVCRVDDVPVGGGRTFLVAATRICLFHVASGFYALADACPHAGASLARGTVRGDTVCCRIHHWRFAIRDGTYLDEDAPRYNARSFPVRVIGDEVLVAVGDGGA
jgi:nitrite reductase/ring-hydroxylating ferredoxin subunit